jgi:hypothetical protein
MTVQRDPKRDAGPARKGSGKRRRFGGKMGTREWDYSKKRYITRPRSQHVDHKVAPIIFERGQEKGGKPHAFQTKSLPGQFKVSAPTKRHHRRGIVRNATTGEQVL